MQENNQNNPENIDLKEENVNIPQSEDENGEIAEEKTDFKGGSTPVFAENTRYVPVYIPVNLETPEQQKKKDIGKVAMLAGFSCIFTTVVARLWVVVYFAVMAALGIAPLRAQEIAQDPFVLQFLQIVISILMFTIPFITVFKVGGHKISSLVNFGKPKKEYIFPLILIGIGFCAFANISVSIAGSFFESFGVDYSVNYGEDPKGLLGFIISFISTAIVPALVEEFACRGIILGSLRKYGDGFAIIASSIVFGLIHGNFEQMPFAFLIGLCLGFITVKSGSLWISCLIHSINNAISVLMSYINVNVPNMDNVIYNVYLSVALVLAIVGACLLSRKGTKVYSLENAETEITEWQKNKWFFTNPAIIVLIIICMIESVSHFF